MLGLDSTALKLPRLDLSLGVELELDLDPDLDLDLGLDLPEPLLIPGVRHALMHVRFSRRGLPWLIPPLVTPRGVFIHSFGYPQLSHQSPCPPGSKTSRDD